MCKSINVETGDESSVVINQKQICSFQIISTERGELTRIRMSNGDVWDIYDPPAGGWMPDAFVTDTSY